MRTVPRIFCPHFMQSLMSSEHRWHTTRWRHGRNSVWTLSAWHRRQMSSARRRMFSSLNLAVSIHTISAFTEFNNSINWSNSESWVTVQQMEHRATSNNMKLVHWPLMGRLLIWYSEEGPGWAATPPSPLLAVPDVKCEMHTSFHPFFLRDMITFAIDT